MITLRCGPLRCGPLKTSSEIYDTKAFASEVEIFSESQMDGEDPVAIVDADPGTEGAERLVACWNACERGRLWSFIRDAIDDGARMCESYKDEPCEALSARIDAKARQLADKFLTPHPGA